MGVSRIRFSRPPVDVIFLRASGCSLVRDSMMSRWQGYVVAEIALPQIFSKAVSNSHDLSAILDSKQVAVRSNTRLNL